MAERKKKTEAAAKPKKKTVKKAATKRRKTSAPLVKVPDSKAKYDYDDPEGIFFKKIDQLAGQGMTDTEIAAQLDISREVFSHMKNGNYNRWTKSQNAVRSAHIAHVLARAREKAIGVARAAYYRAAIGGRKIKSVTTRYVQARCICNGNDPKCPDCGGTGIVVLTSKAVVQETESELAPNIQALSTFLFHHDPNWRKIQRGIEDDEELPQNVKQGIPVSHWIDAEMTDDWKNVENDITTESEE